MGRGGDHAGHGYGDHEMNLSPEFVVYARESGRRASGDKKRLGGPHRQHEVSLLAKEGNVRGSEQEVPGQADLGSGS